MRRILLISLFLAGFCAAFAQEPATEHASVTTYLQILLEEPVDTIDARVDRLIDSVGLQHPELQSKVAGIAFDFFTSSPVMGHEAVAVHIADNWFLNRRLKLENEELFPIIATYAEFNRLSLVGCPLPELEMESIEGFPVQVRDASSACKVLFFYDTECSTCRREAPLLADLARNYHGESLTLFAIYTQGDRQAWESYVRDVFSGIDNPDVTVVHLWDPEAATGFHKKYAVLSTPVMFLADSQNTIVGRGLDCEALAQMLNIRNTQVQQYKHLFDNVFDQFQPLSYQHVEGLIDVFHERTAPNPELHAELFLQLFDYLRTSDSYPKQQGALYLAEHYIAADPESWSPEFLNRTIHSLALARLNPVGEPATNLVLQNKRGRAKLLYDGRHYATLVFFHLVDCQQCQREYQALKKLKADFYDADIQVVMVYVGEDRDRWRQFVRKEGPCRWKFLNDFAHTSNMRQLYDLEFVPHLYLLDESGVIIAKDIQVSELKELLPLL